MDSLSLSAVQRANMMILLLARDAALEDMGAACCRYGLSLALLKQLRSLSPDAIFSIVTGIGNEALFYPRADLETLLTLPASVSAVVASARPRAAIASVSSQAA